MASIQQIEHVEDTKKETEQSPTETEQSPMQQEREQPWRKIMPEIEALNKANADSGETYVCDQGFFSQSLAA
jgi:hypothetical protein